VTSPLFEYLTGPAGQSSHQQKGPGSGFRSSDRAPLKLSQLFRGRHPLGPDKPGPVDVAPWMSPTGPSGCRPLNSFIGGRVAPVAAAEEPAAGRPRGAAPGIPEQPRPGHRRHVIPWSAFLATLAQPAAGADAPKDLRAQRAQESAENPVRFPEDLGLNFRA
jgi:hypothetical protein